MLHSSVHVLLNESPAPASVALFDNDLIETQKDAAARIEKPGSTADISAESMVQFHGDELVLDHGRLVVNTSRGLRVRVGCITITPRNPAEWTNYEVDDVNGKVTVFAAKQDVYVDARSDRPKDIKQGKESERSLVRESERKTREEKCGGAYLNSAQTPGVNGILSSPWAVAGGAAAVAGITCYALCRTDNNPVSPTRP